MNNRQEISNRNAQRIAALTNRTREVQDDLCKKAVDFFNIGGVSTPVEGILDLLNNLFSGNDSWENEDDGTSTPLYRVYGDQHIRDQVFITIETVKFLVNLNDDIINLKHLKNELTFMNERSVNNG